MRRFLFLFLVYSFQAGAILYEPPRGAVELEAPHLSFLRVSEAALLYEKAGYQTPFSGERSEAFLDEIFEENYQAAEALLLKEVKDPHALINLMLLYLYLNEKEKALEIFTAWQKGAYFDQKVILLHLFAAKPGATALQELAPFWDHPSLRHYALYLSAALTSSPGETRKALAGWEETLHRAMMADELSTQHGEPRPGFSKDSLPQDEADKAGPGISEQNQEGQTGVVSSGAGNGQEVISKEGKQLYLKARLDWATRTKNRSMQLALQKLIGGEPSSLAALQKSLPVGLSKRFWEELFLQDQKSLSADLYTRYFVWLLENQQWEKLQRFSKEYRLAYLHSDQEMKKGLDAYQSRAVGIHRVLEIKVKKVPEKSKKEKPRSIFQKGPQSQEY